MSKSTFLFIVVFLFVLMPIAAELTKLGHSWFLGA